MRHLAELIGRRVWVDGEEDHGTVTSVEVDGSSIFVKMDSDGIVVSAAPQQIREDQ